jgi:hypothetical protein
MARRNRKGWPVELIVAVLHTLKFLLPKAFLIFGVCCGIIEFLIRDKEIDAIRNTFIWLWIQTDAISKLSLMTAVASKRGQVAFKICAILTFLAYQGFLLVTRQLSGGFDFKDFTGSDYAYVLALSLIPLLLSTGVFYLIRRDVEDYVYYCISGTFIDALFRFSIIPVLSSLVAPGLIERYNCRLALGHRLSIMRSRATPSGDEAIPFASRSKARRMVSIGSQTERLATLQRRNLWRSHPIATTASCC